VVHPGFQVPHFFIHHGLAKVGYQNIRPERLSQLYPHLPKAPGLRRFSKFIFMFLCTAGEQCFGENYPLWSKVTLFFSEFQKLEGGRYKWYIFKKCSLFFFENTPTPMYNDRPCQIITPPRTATFGSEPPFGPQKKNFR
jgi:hypothetical protein